MDEQNTNSNIADAAVSDIHKDFVVVGKHRVHSWYAWAIVGIVFGMALGIVYVANRTSNFSASDAAAIKISKGNLTVTGPGKIDYVLAIMTTNNNNKWLGNRPTPYSSGPITVQDIRPTMTSTGHYIQYLLSPSRTSLGVIGFNSVENKMYIGKSGANGFTIDTTLGIDLSKTAPFKLQGVYVKDNGSKVDVKISGTLYCPSNLPGNLNCNDYDNVRKFPITDGNAQVRAGIPLFTDSLKFTMPSEKTRTVFRNIVFPKEGTYKIIFRKDGTKFIISKVIAVTTGADENTAVDVLQDSITPPTPAQCKPYEVDQDDMFFDCMNHPGSYRVHPPVKNPAQVTPPQCELVRSAEGKDACTQEYYADKAAAASKPSGPTATQVIEQKCAAKYGNLNDGGDTYDSCVADKGIEY